jgi:uncharacterized damage-inducible protein DinB
VQTGALIAEAFERVRGSVHRAVEGLSESALTYRPTADANSIAWLVWHIARIQDDHVAALHDAEQTWTADGWCDRFALPFARGATGYDQTSAEVGAVRASAAELLGYYDAVHACTVEYVRTLQPDDLDRIVDRAWDPPVTQGVRLVSVINDNLQHVGQAAYLRGLAERGPT